MNLPFFIGSTVLEFDLKHVEKILNLCNENAIAYRPPRLFEEKASIEISRFNVKALKNIAEKHKIELTEIQGRGVLSIAYRCRKRVGLFVGAVIALIIFFYSSGLVWDIRIDGASRVSEKELKKVFAECGLSVGTRLQDIDCDVLENKILILSDEISWVSVNLHENVASVEIRELDFAPPSENEALYSNVVASREGVVVGFGEINGRTAVKIGDAVCKGQLLISGIEGGDGKPLRLLNASGEVFAEVEETLEIKIEQKYIKKVAKNQIKSEKSLIFFKNEIKFFSNSRNSEASCDKIEVIENFYLSDKRLPLALKTVKIIEYDEIEVLRSQNEMEELAQNALNERLNELLLNAELLLKSTSISECDDGIILKCKIKYIANIAEVRDLTL